MIQRYSRPLMREIWTEENKLKIWLRIELLVGLAVMRGFRRSARASSHRDRAPRDRQLSRRRGPDVRTEPSMYASRRSGLIGSPVFRILS